MTTRRDIRATRTKDMNRLRGRMDGDDMFMSAHQIKTVRTRDRVVPAWAISDTEVQKIIQRSFPFWRTNKTQKARAGRWTRIIHLYYRMQMPISQVASELGTTVGVILTLTRSIKRAANGLRTRDSKPRSSRKRGPSAISPAPIEGNRRKGHERIQSPPLHIARNGSAGAGRTTSKEV